MSETDAMTDTAEPVPTPRTNASPMAVVTRQSGRGMITLRGDLSSDKLRAICTKITGQDMPEAGQANVHRDTGLAWMSPDEILVMLPKADVPGAIASIDAALKGRHYMAVDVSDARAVIRVRGSGAREVMAKLCPVDLHPEAFGPGQFRRTRMGQVAAAFWMRDAATFEVVCFRSVGDYAFDLLTVSAEAGPVVYF